MVETLVFNGITFRRYPNSPRISDRRYFRRCTSVKALRTSLHRYVWEFYRGPIPVGHDVHHKFKDDYATIDPDRLECLPESVHASMHSIEGNIGKPKSEEHKLAISRGRKAYLARQTPEEAAALGAALSKALTGRAIPWADKIRAGLNKPEVKAVLSARTSGRLWYTNGPESVRLYPGDEIPEGWRRGRK